MSLIQEKQSQVGDLDTTNHVSLNDALISDNERGKGGMGVVVRVTSDISLISRAFCEGGFIMFSYPRTIVKNKTEKTQLLLLFTSGDVRSDGRLWKYVTSGLHRVRTSCLHQCWSSVSFEKEPSWKGNIIFDPEYIFVPFILPRF